jgi:hypothetical protein
MPCNPNITPTQKAALEKQMTHLLSASDTASQQLADDIQALMNQAQLAKGAVSVKQIIVTGLQAGQTKDEILAAVKGIFPDSKAAYADIAYYKSKLKKAAELGDANAIAGNKPFTKVKPFVPPVTPPTWEEKMAKKHFVAVPDVKAVTKLVFVDLKAAGIDVGSVESTVGEILAKLSDAVGASGGTIPDMVASVEGMIQKALNGDVGIVSLLDDVLGSSVDINGLLFKAETKAKEIAAIATAAKLKQDAQLTVQTAAFNGIEVSADLFIDQATLDSFKVQLADFIAEPTQAKILALKDAGAGITKAAATTGLSPFSTIENPTTIASVIEHGLKQGKSAAHILQDVKTFFPNANTTENSIAFYKTKLKKAGVLPGYKGKGTTGDSLQAIATKVKAGVPLGLIDQAQLVPGDDVMGKWLSQIQLGGSNGAQVWEGKDGVKRVVKFYTDGSQAYGEHLANQIYRQLGVNAPTSGVFVVPMNAPGAMAQGGKIAFWSKYDETASVLKLSASTASQVLDGFASDILTANWDVIGLSVDNVRFSAEMGGPVRVDNGSSFLFRAQAAKRKPTSLLNDITEFEKFVNGSNPSYAKQFKYAKTSPIQMGERLVQQINDIEALEAKFHNWKNLVDTIVGPGMSLDDKTQIVKMLEARSKLLYAKRATIHDSAALLQARTAARAGSIAEVKARAKNIVDSPTVAKLRAEIRTALNKPSYGSTKTLADELKSPTALPTHHPGLDKLRTIREEMLDFVMNKEYGASWEQMRSAYNGAIAEWYGSSNSSGGASLKVALEKEFSELLTTFHGHFVDNDPVLRAKYLMAQVKMDTLDAIRKQMAVDRDFAKAFVREIMGKDTITLYRGVRRDYFTAAGAPIPQKGEEFVDIGNPMSSWSFSKSRAAGFGHDIVMKAEVPIDDIQSIFVLQPYATNYWGEKEAFVIGRPQHVTIE